MTATQRLEDRQEARDQQRLTGHMIARMSQAASYAWDLEKEGISAIVLVAPSVGLFCRVQAGDGEARSELVTWSDIDHAEDNRLIATLVKLADQGKEPAA